MSPSTPVAPARLVRFDAADVARRRLICLPFAGGGPATYRSWPELLPSDVEVVAAVLPGRDPASRQHPPDSIGELVESVDAAIGELDDRDPLPYALFGHSMGALIAYELTLALERAGDRGPSHLFVSGRRPPDEPHRGDPIHHLDDEAFLDAMQGTYGGVPAIVRDEPELLALFLPSLRADIRALETHEAIAGRTVSCPVSVYGGAEDRHPRPEQLSGWQRVARETIAVEVFDGDHFYLAASARRELIADIGARWDDGTTTEVGR